MDWKKINEKTIRKGFRSLIERVFELPDGNIAYFDIKKEGPAVCIVPLTKDNEVILFKQFRPGPEKVLLELPGGGFENRESPKQAATRELLEETGYVGNLQLVCVSWDDAYSTMIRYNFVATNCQKQQDPSLDEGEFGEVVKLSLEKFREHIRTGELTDIESAYLGLDYLHLL
ncbi:MAG: NUDIX hydrolase [Candidatus Spechtbacterales bacterium]|nr:NUDIX hydrolase [Candidatus Spechtbacterales bacterium]